MDSLTQIIINASEKTGINVGRQLVIRACQISDGFPYFVHLLAHNLFFEVFDRIDSSNSATTDDFHAATHAAIRVAEYELRERYSSAFQKTKNSRDYEEILWSFSE